MIKELNISSPLVSVVIPCYNQGGFLPEAIESVIDQTYSHVEIIVVDDGSEDDTWEVTKKYNTVKYICQENKGLSAARNTGFFVSRGDYLVFLDADDWLYPEAIETNLQQLIDNPDVAFVSGAHDKTDSDKKIFKEENFSVDSDHYLQLLRGNYIGMHAAVMYRSSILEEFKFDTSLEACEDYDLYLKISRKYPVKAHSKKIAAYRIHSSGMSADLPLMLETVLKVLHSQKLNLRNTEEKKAYQTGLKVWKDYYCQAIYDHIRNPSADKHTGNKKLQLDMLRKYKPGLYIRYLLKKSA